MQQKRKGLYIEKAKQFKFKIIGFYFLSTVGEAITRNKNGTGKEQVPPAGIGGSYKRLQEPTFERRV